MSYGFLIVALGTHFLTEINLTKITFSPFPLKLDHSAPKWIKMLLTGKENNFSLGGSGAGSMCSVAQSCPIL